MTCDSCNINFKSGQERLPDPCNWYVAHNMITDEYFAVLKSSFGVCSQESFWLINKKTYEHPSQKSIKTGLLIYSIENNRNLSSFKETINNSKYKEMFSWYYTM